jgi:hypothetical protein
MRRACREPVTFNEKLLRKMAYDRNPLLTTFADKVAVRDYVADVIGPEYLTELHAVGRRPEDIDWEALPREYACKVNHGSGGVVLVSEDVDAGVRLPEPGTRVPMRLLAVHPDALDVDRLRALVRQWLAREYSWGPGGRPEWAYQHIERRVLVEELLKGDSDGNMPRDCRFLMFNGTCRLIHSNAWTLSAQDGLPHQTRTDLRTPEWEDPGFHSALYAPSDVQPERPATLEQMISLAERLAAPVDFVRVDFYVIGDRIVFGELTNYPNGAANRFVPASADALLGGYLVQDY